MLICQLKGTEINVSAHLGIIFFKGTLYLLPNKTKLHYSNVILFMYYNNLVSYGHVPVVLNASISTRKNELSVIMVYHPQLCN
jgi:hypothetical protein